MRTPQPLSRRRFLKTAAVASAAVQLAPKLHAAASASENASHAYPENGTLVPDEGWRLWIDDKAAWKDDDIFLPEDIAWTDNKLCGKGKPLPVNAPTGGWSALVHDAGKEVVLPTSVEQHFWGKYGSRPYTPEEYRYAADTKGGTITPVAPADDNVPQNGAYFGVSWFFRSIEIPPSMRAKRIFLHIRGAHLRAEVYLNGQLCGYSIMEELPFEADLTHAADHGGENHLAIRITNPFGRFDWVDGLNAKWHNVSLYRSHGFGALDRGMTISAHGAPIKIADLWVLNTPDANKVSIHYRLQTLDDKPSEKGAIRFEIIDPKSGNVIAKDERMILPTHKPYIDRAFSISKFHFEMKLDKPHLWDIDQPNLYYLRATLLGPPTDTRTIAFGFRSFAPEGIGPEGSTSNALFRLNGRRIRIYSAISWGYWGLNGMFPVPELAVKEVTAAKTLGLNCLNFHRNLAKEDVLRAHDTMGLLRYMEPGAGKMAIGKLPTGVQSNAAGTVMEDATTEAEKFAQRYMFVKCVEMVKAHRSHPSVIEYCLQNEIGADLRNPATLAILKAMHDEDPSRCVVLNDGFVARGAAQAWYEPWSSDLKEGKLHRSDQEKWGGWWNNHQGAGDQWYDEFYKSPTDYTYRAPFRNVLTEFGEMEGCARPDVHGLDIHQITETYKKYGGISYDLGDHDEVVAGYNKFLDRWGFRSAYPTPDHVFLAVGRTCYESWMNYMENARISDELDYAVISGWESTAIENHSGIVDNLRNFKSDPRLIGDTLKPIRPIAKQRALCIEQGKPAIFDLYFANDTPQPATGTLTFSMITPSGKKTDLITLPAPAHVTDQFSYLLKEAFETPKLIEEGLYRFRFAISSVPLATQTKEIWVTRSPRVLRDHPITIGVSGITIATHKQLNTLGMDFGITVHDFKPGEKYDAIISGGLTSHTSLEQNVGETTGGSMPVMKPGHIPEPGETALPTELGHLQHGILEAVQGGTPLFAIPQADTLSEGVAQQLAAAGAFTYNGAVGDFRAPWMGNWYFGREHALFAGLPTNAALGSFYQIKGRQSNGLLVEGKDVEVIVGYSRDHDRKVGAGTFTTRLGKTKILYHRTPDFHPVLQQRFLANALHWLTS
jgi:beta-galactosidase